MILAQHRFIVWIALTCLAACAPPREITEMAGETMGTTYRIAYPPTGASTTQESQAIESLLENINQSMSTYIDTSLVSRLNASEDISAWHPVDAHFETVFRRSREIHDDTKGAFNPAVGPLVNAWGFGPAAAQAPPDEAAIRDLLKLTSFEGFVLRPWPPAVRKSAAGAQLDFSAIAKGYGVDAVGALLEQWSVRNYIVEIGGEVLARGRHPGGRGWRVGIATPSEDISSGGELQAILTLENSALATSGNYRNYRQDAGKRFAHILNPRTGYPENSPLLSVSVLARDAMTADAYATAFMVMGLDESLRFVETREGLEAYFIAGDPEGKIIEKRSSGFPRAPQ